LKEEIQIKKGLLVTLVMVLLCLAASGLATVKLPTHLDEVTSQLPEKPKAPAFELEVTTNGVKVTITDESKIEFVDYIPTDDNGDITFHQMTPDEMGKVFFYTWDANNQPGEFDMIEFCLDDGDDTTMETVTFNIGDKKPINFFASKMAADSGILSVNWDEEDTPDSITYMTSDGKGEWASVTFNGKGDLSDYNTWNDETDLYWDAEGNLISGFIYGEDETYWWYDNGQWYLDDEPVDIPAEAAEILAQMKAALEEMIKKEEQTKKLEVKWYAKNSVCVAGLSLRDDLHMSDKWYNVAPIDLTQEGTQTLYLVAGNRHHIGKAYVTVADGNVTVDYKLHGGHGYIKDECVKWFTSLDEITAEFIENPTSDLTFGQAVSIAEDLGGADTAILFIRNVATYRQPYTNAGGELSRYWRNRDRWIESREDMMTLLGIEAK